MAKPIDDQERNNLLGLLAAIDCFREIRTTMPLQYMATFLMVALDEGKSVGEYAVKANVSPSVMSRHILDIGARNRHMEKGFDLVFTKQNPQNLREHTVFLSDKGRALIHKLSRRLS